MPTQRADLPAPTTTATPGRRLSARTHRAYAGDWARFADWCAATDHPALPTTPEAVAVYLDENPAAPATQARRVAAINRIHREHGHLPPGHDPAIAEELHVLRGRGSDARGPARPTRVAVEEVLRLIPSHGWPAGLFGRRDRCLLLVSQIGGLSHTEVHALGLGDVQVEGHGLAVRGRGRTVHITGRDDPRICPACIYRRWQLVRDALERLPSIRPLRRQFHEACAVTATSPHVCHSPGRHDASSMPLFIAADQHGWPVTHTGISARAISTIVTAAARGQALPHRSVPVVETVEPDDPPHDTPPPAPVRGPVEPRADLRSALARRDQDRRRLDTVEKLLFKLNADLENLNARTVELLELASRTAMRK